MYVSTICSPVASAFDLYSNMEYSTQFYPNRIASGLNDFHTSKNVHLNHKFIR